MRQHPGASRLIPLVQWSQRIGLWRTAGEGTTHCQLNWSDKKKLKQDMWWGGWEMLRAVNLCTVYY